MQTLRFVGLALLAWCQPYYEYVPVTGASISVPTHATVTEADASGELPSTAEHQSTATIPGVPPPFFPLFPFPQVDLGREYAPQREPAYGPGGAAPR